MKKFFLSMFALLSAMQVWATFNATINGITYILDNGYAKAGVTVSTLISGYSGDISIPSTVTHQGLVYSVEYIAAEAFKGSSVTSVDIPSSVTSINYNAFKDCKSLTSVNLPSSITSIGGFSGCTNLYSITIPNSVKTIGSSAFSECTNLASINIPSSVTYIGDNAFWCCNLTSVEIPSSVTHIGIEAFFCRSITSVVSNIQVPFVFGEDAFLVSDDCVLTVPYGTRDAYIAAGWTTNIFGGGIKEMVEDIEMSSNEICTFCSTHDLDFSVVSGLKAYIVSGFSPSTGRLTLTPVTEVPAGEGLLLKGEEGSYEVPYTTTDMYYSNLLTGVTTTTEISPTDGDQTNFILANGIHGINFYTLSESGDLAAGKAYLHLPTTAVAALTRPLKLVFDDETTGIESICEEEKADDVCYDLQGRRISRPDKGLYIVNGKKIFIK